MFSFSPTDEQEVVRAFCYGDIVDLK